MSVIWGKWSAPPFPASHLPPNTRRFKVGHYTVDWDGATTPSAVQIQEMIATARAGVPLPVWDRKSVFLDYVAESSVVAHAGSVLVVSFTRDFFSTQVQGVEIRDYFTNKVLADFEWPGALGCAIADAGLLHIFGVTDWSGRNELLHSALGPNLQPIGRDSVWQAGVGDVGFNSSVCRSPAGFTMALETHAGGNIFLESTSALGPWSVRLGKFNRDPTFYAAAPRLVHANGFFHLFYLEVSGQTYRTRVARSASLALGSWTTSPRIVLSPETGEGINASDLDFDEFGGRTYGVYFDGDQATFGHTKKCEYFGDVSELLAELFE